MSWDDERHSWENCYSKITSGGDADDDDPLWNLPYRISRSLEMIMSVIKKVYHDHKENVIEEAEDDAEEVEG